MCFGDLLRALHEAGLNVTTSQVRWAITSGKVSRPPLDGSLRFDFGEQHLAELRNYFRVVAAGGGGVGAARRRDRGKRLASTGGLMSVFGRTGE